MVPWRPPHIQKTPLNFIFIMYLVDVILLEIHVGQAPTLFINKLQANQV